MCDLKAKVINLATYKHIKGLDIPIYHILLMQILNSISAIVVTLKSIGKDVPNCNYILDKVLTVMPSIFFSYSVNVGGRKLTIFSSEHFGDENFGANFCLFAFIML